MKKILAVVLVAVLCVATLTACASTPAESSAPAESASEAPAESASAEASPEASEAATTGGSLDKIKEAGELVMLTNAQFPPYEYLGDDNKPAGVDIDIAQKIADEIGVELNVVDMEFDGLIPALQGGKGDFVAAGLTITEERKQNVDFSDPYATSTQMIIVPKENATVASADDLKGKTIGVQLGTTGDLYVTDEIEGATVKPYKSAIEAGMDLANGKLDAVVVDQLPAQSIVANNDTLVVLDTPLTEEQYAMAVQKGNTELQEVINKVLGEMKDEMTELTQKHFDLYAATPGE